MKLRIEIEENEYALYDFFVYADEELVATSANYTREEWAIEQAYIAFEEWRNDGMVQL
ncbi:MAG: hypothetical protein Tp182DCM212571_67 [Prokaryotic dsDNA virus sp.]|nr:MAG: hypothetical protein Tp182DCM212571_67 [Prokaryotic dsDNA virus sp.]